MPHNITPDMSKEDVYQRFCSILRNDGERVFKAYLCMITSNFENLRTSLERDQVIALGERALKEVSPLR